MAADPAVSTAPNRYGTPEAWAPSRAPAIAGPTTRPRAPADCWYPRAWPRVEGAATGHRGRHRGLDQPLTDGQGKQGRRGYRPRVGGRQQDQPDRVGQQTGRESWQLAESQHQRVHQANLHRDDDDPHGGEHRGRRGDAEAKSLLAEQSESGLEATERNDGAEGDHEQHGDVLRPAQTEALVLAAAGGPLARWLVSGRRNHATTVLAAARPAARKNGSRGPLRAARAPIAGPATKPRPKAAPSRPNSRDRSLGPARSAADAWATDTLAPDPPSIIRPMSNSARPPARPVRRLPMAVPARATMRTGLRPNRSETRPHRGENTNLAAEKTVTSSAAWNEDVPNRLA